MSVGLINTLFQSHNNLLIDFICQVMQATKKVILIDITSSVEFESNEIENETSSTFSFRVII